MPKSTARACVLRQLFLAMAALCVLPTVSYGASAASPRLVGALLLQTAFPVLPVTWFSFAFIAVLAVITVAAIIYQLSTILESPSARGWARLQVYEGLLSVVLLLVFAGILFIFAINPEGSFAQANLVSSNGQYSCVSAQDLFQLSICDLSRFNSFAFTLAQAMFYVSFYSGFVPGLSISGGLEVPPTSFTFGASAGIPSFLPLSLSNSFSTGFAALLTLDLLNQVQLILLSGCLLWLSFFVTLGLIARTVGFMRTFGGAMIALGLGLGLVYPFLVSLTYGYIDYQLGASSTCGTYACTTVGFVQSIMYDAIDTLIFQGWAPQDGVIFQFGAAIAGLTFIPFLNFIVLDAFIVDFSQAIGERLDFMSMITGLI